MKIIVLQPSSAAAEQVFSILDASIGQSQTQCLEDIVETSIIIIAINNNYCALLLYLVNNRKLSRTLSRKDKFW